MEGIEANIRIGDFQIVKRLGAGGISIVYLARQLSLDRLVAFKVIGTALNDHSEIARFHREARAVAKLDHPGIAGIYFVGQDSQLCYLVTEFVDGASIREVLKLLVKLSKPNQSLDTILEKLRAGQDSAPEVRFDQDTLTYTPGSEVVSEPPAPPGPGGPGNLFPAKGCFTLINGGPTSGQRGSGPNLLTRVRVSTGA
jgi:Protein kinase domain